jgi:hypothetical protein
MVLIGLSKTFQSLMQNRGVANHVSREEAESSTERQYQIRFSYDWGVDSPFWCGNDVARAKFDVGPIEPEELGLSIQTSERVRTLEMA